MLVSIDDGKTYHQASVVRVLFAGFNPDNEEELHFTFTDEGLVTDLIKDEQLDTDSQTIDEIADGLRLCDE